MLFSASIESLDAPMRAITFTDQSELGDDLPLRFSTQPGVLVSQVIMLAFWKGRIAERDAALHRDDVAEHLPLQRLSRCQRARAQTRLTAWRSTN